MWNVTRQRFVEAATIEKWAILNFSKLRDSEVHGFAQALTAVMRERGDYTHLST
jgi:hypothetical protein